MEAFVRQSFLPFNCLDYHSWFWFIFINRPLRPLHSNYFDYFSLHRLRSIINFFYSFSWGHWLCKMEIVINSRRQPLKRLLFRRSPFLQFKEFELYWGAVVFTTRRGVLEKSFFKINFFGVNFETGNEFWVERKEWIFCSYCCFQESNKRPLILEQFLYNNWWLFFGHEAFYWEMWQKMEKTETTFNFFCSFFCFFLFFRQVS